LSDPQRAYALIERADRAPEMTSLVADASRIWSRGFGAGAEWMGHALALLRQRADVPAQPSSLLGVFKYGLATAAALGVVAISAAVHAPWLLPGSVLAFYAVEAQLVFLFLVVADGSRHPVRDSRAWTVRAGGTVAVMRVVMPIAARMLFGGLVGRGFLRSWCVGCFAVVLWYDDLHNAYEVEA
jgi:hypothetical protein